METININTSKTIVLLIGVSKISDDKSITPIPNVEKNLELFRKYLQDNTIIGIPSANIIDSLNESKLSIERKILTAAREAQNSQYTLIVYYAGHGILNADDYKLYLTTKNSTKEFLESDSISINIFSQMLKKSKAGRKIIILDACHSGQIHNAMSDAHSHIVVELSRFEGTYVMTSANEYEPAYYPEHDKNAPTYFTGELFNILENGIINNKPVLSIGEIFDEIKKKLVSQTPQQSSFQNADEIIFAKNKSFDESQREKHDWEMILKQNTLQGFVDFMETYPESKFTLNAKSKISILEEIEKWNVIAEENTILGYYNFIQNNPDSDFVSEAYKRIKELEESTLWNEVKMKNTIGAYLEYKNSYPYGTHIKEVQETLGELIKHEKEIKLWRQALSAQTKDAFEKYLTKYPTGIYAFEAIKEIEKLDSPSSVELDEEVTENKIEKVKTSKINWGIPVFLALIIVVLIFQIWMDKTSTNQESELTKAAIRGNNLGNSKREANKKILLSNQFYKLLANAKMKELQGEDFLYGALVDYQMAYDLNFNNSLAQVKVDSIQNVIRSLTEKYISKAKNFMKAEGDGKQRARQYYIKAYKLNPKDNDLRLKIESIK